jgi:hypothetical protein
MRKNKFKELAGFLVIFSLLALSLNSQLKYTLQPFFNSFRSIPGMLARDDAGQLKELSPSIYQIIEEINKYPPEANFYFEPHFAPWQSQGVWWWYVYIISRYLCYPRKVFSLAGIAYHNSRIEYLNKFIGQAKFYSQLSWLRGQGIQYVVLLRQGRVLVLPVSAEIVPP